MWIAAADPCRFRPRSPKRPCVRSCVGVLPSVTSRAISRRYARAFISARILYRHRLPHSADRPHPKYRNRQTHRADAWRHAPACWCAALIDDASGSFAWARWQNRALPARLGRCRQALARLFPRRATRGRWEEDACPRRRTDSRQRPRQGLGKGASRRGVVSQRDPSFKGFARGLWESSAARGALPLVLETAPTSPRLSFR